MLCSRIPSASFLKKRDTFVYTAKSLRKETFRRFKIVLIVKHTTTKLCQSSGSSWPLGLPRVSLNGDI